VVVTRGDVVVVVCDGGGAFSLLPAAAFILSGLCFHFKPASLPVFCCWFLSISRSVFVWPSVSW
jgi:hypothetical protein